MLNFNFDYDFPDVARRMDEIIIHSTATRPSQDIGVEEIRRWHKMRDFVDIGYHFVILRNGEIQVGRSIHKIGAHTRGKNTGTIGISMVGGVHETEVVYYNDTRYNKAENNFTDAQWESLEYLVKALMDRYGISEVSGHGEHAITDCPSFDVQEWRFSVGV